MKTSFQVLGILSVVFILIFSCQKKDPECVFVDFPVSLELQGNAVVFPDSFINAIGGVQSVGNDFWCYIYDSEDCLLVTDSMFMPIRTFARKGEGPGEVSGMTDYGIPVYKDGLYVVYDTYKYKLYGTNGDYNYELKEVVDFGADSVRKCLPSKVVPIDDDRYVCVKDDFSYGLIEYDSKEGTFKEWPLGYDFENPEKPDMRITDLRIVKHNLKRKIVAEIYDRIPSVIIHDESGDIKNRFTYGGYKFEDINDATPRCFRDIALSDKYIWIVYEDSKDSSEKYKLFVLDYDGNPKAMLLMEEGINKIYVDEGRNRIIGVDPNSEDKNIVIYDIPEILR